MTATAADRPWVTLSLDLDDTWAYLRTRGEPDWAEAPSVLPLAVSRLLPLLAERGLTITVFVVGRDATLPAGQDAVRALAEAGHEIASHSLLHRGELAALPPAEVGDDLRATAEALEQVTGRRPVGFRCPSFGSGPALLHALAEGGYSYDASVLPTSLAPLLKLYYKLRVARGDEPPADLFGPASSARMPLSPFRWDTGGAGLLEFPVSTLPVLRTPVHMSYLQALGAASPRLAHGYLRLALRSLRARAVPASFLVHASDLLDAEDAPRLAFFPGMRRPAAAKLDQLGRALSALAEGADVLTLETAAQRLRDTVLPVRPVGGTPEAATAAPRGC